MSNLAVKYRPKSFEDVVEQKNVMTMLNSICKSDPLDIRNFLLIGPAGCGKAQPLYSKVLTPEGFISMKDVKVGQKVITSSGATAVVSGVYPQGVRPIYEIELQDRSKIRVSDEHLNVFYRYNEDKKCREDFCMTTKDLIDMFDTSRFKLRIDVPKVESFGQDSDPLPIDPYLLGALIGDGSFSHNFQFSNSEEDVIEKVDYILRKDWNKMLRKLEGDNVDYSIVDISVSKYKYTFQYKGQVFTTIASIQDRLVSDGYPKFDPETILRICENSATHVLRNYPELVGSLVVEVDTNYHNCVEKDPLYNVLRDLGLLVRSADKHIPEEYLRTSYSNRLLLLQGLFDTDGYTDKNGATVFTTCSDSLSEDFAFLVRSLGIRDTIVSHPAKYLENGKYKLTGSTAYDHNIKVPNELLYCSSEKHMNRRMLRQNPPIRNIISITYVGEEECQCIMVDHPDHTYISDDFIPTHNTTAGRIISRILNDGKGEPIELDAASHSGVDTMRDIVQQARSYPVGCNYKVFIIDECFTGDTEILTDRGYVRFDVLTKNDKIAQYTDEGKIEFVEPVRHIKRYHSGQIVKVYPKFGDRCVRMTPNHIQPVYNYYSDEISISTIDKREFVDGDRFILSGEGTGFDEDLTIKDRLHIALIADGHILDTLSNTNEHKWQIRLSRKEKITRFIHLLESSGYDWGRYNCEDGVSEFWCKTPNTITKKLSDVFDLDMGYHRANQFIDETMNWDGSYRSGYPAYYSSTIKSNADFVSAIGTLAGYSAQVSLHSYQNPNYSDEFQVALIPGKFNRRFKPRKEYEDFEGFVYCVEVPSHKIFVRADGFTFMSGNCHAISNAGWQILLKTLEESPAKSIFILCTTNPEKIPATILSRVQQFPLSKISLDGIYNRLIYVIKKENEEGRNIQYTENSVMFIAKLANGGMRDALTLLDKALSYSSNLSEENLSVALNLANYDDYFALLSAYAKKNNTDIAKIVNTVYNSGVNFVKWMEGFHSFVMNIVKYIYLQDISCTMIPSYYQDKISKYSLVHSAICLKLSHKLVDMIYDLKSTQYLQEVALTYLCSIPTKK